MVEPKTNSQDENHRAALRGSPQSGLAFSTLGFFAGFAAVCLLGPAAQHFRDAMQLSGLQVGFLIAAPQLTGSLLRIPFGAWVEVGGGRRPMVVLLLLSLLGMLGLLSIVTGGTLSGDQYAMLLLFGSLCGCGVASFSVAMPQVAYWYPAGQQGRALGLCGGVGNLAPGCFALLLPVAIASFGLASAYTAWLLFLALATAVYALGSRDAYSFQLRARGVNRESASRISRELGQELQPSGGMLSALRQSAALAHTWTLVALYFTCFGGFLALVVWLPSYWSAVHGLEPTQAGLYTALAFALPCSLMRIYGGSLSDRFGGERVAIASFGAIFLGAALMTLQPSFAPAVCALLATALAMGIAQAAVFKLVAQFVPEALGGAAGWVGGLGAFGGFVIPPLLGALVDAFGASGYSRGFAILVALSLLAVLLIQRRFVGFGFTEPDAARQDLPTDPLALDAS